MVVIYPKILRRRPQAAVRENGISTYLVIYWDTLDNFWSSVLLMSSTHSIYK